MHNVHKRKKIHKFRNMNINLIYQYNRRILIATCIWDDYKEFRLLPHEAMGDSNDHGLIPRNQPRSRDLF